MAQTDRAKLIDKINKLLSLATSPNEEEAARAAAKAQELMEKHNLSDFDLGKSETFDIFIQELKVSNDINLWEQNFMIKLADLFDCMVFKEKTEKEGIYSAKTVGQRNNIDVLHFTYKFLINIIKSLADREAIRSQAIRDELRDEKAFNLFKDSFCMGCSDRIILRLKKSKEDRHFDPANVKSTALVLMSRELVKAWADENLKLDGAPEEEAKEFCRDGYADGYRVGGTLGLNKEISGSTVQKKLK